MKSDPNFKLPAWLEAELPEMKPVAVLTKEGEHYFIENCSEGRRGPYATLVEAYDSFSKRDEARDLTFASVCLEENESMDGSAIFMPDGRFLISFTDDDNLWLLQEAYRSWKIVYQEWQDNSEDFLTSYYFLEQHPAFWVRCEDEKTFSWQTDAGRPHEIFPWKDDAGNVCVSLEAGGHVAPEYTSHYHDLRLDVTAPTFEEAVVKLAQQVDAVFDEEGNERPGVVFEKSPLQLELESRIKELQERESQ